MSDITADIFDAQLWTPCCGWICWTRTLRRTTGSRRCRVCNVRQTTEARRRRKEAA